MDTRQLLEPLAEQAGTWAANEMAYLTNRSREIMHYPLSGYTLMDGYLDKVWTVLETSIGDDFGYLEGEIADWNGTAASDFKSLFYNRYGAVKENQQYLLRSLQGALEVSRRTVEYSQQSVINAVTSTRDALLEQLYERSVDGSRTSAKAALLVVAGGFTVLGAVTGGALWAAVAGGAAFSASVAASELPASGTEERDIEGRSADDLSASLLDAIRDIDNFLIKQLDLLHDDLRRIRAHIRGLHAEHKMRPRRPLLVDEVSGEDFYHSSSDEYP